MDWGTRKRTAQFGGASQERGWLNLIPAPAAVLGRDARVLACNAEAAVVLGCGDNGASLDGARRRWVTRVFSALAGEGREISLLIRRTAGRRQPFIVRGRLLDDGELLVLFEDCSRQFQLRSAGRAQDRSLRRLLDEGRDAALVESGGVVQWGNEAAAALFGRPRATLAHATLSDLLGPHSDNGSDIEVRGEAGSRFVRVMQAPVSYRRASCRLLTLVDRTPERTLAASLREAEELLRRAQKMEAVGRLAAGIAHDFNNVLTAIQGHTQFLLEDLAPGSQALDDAEEIRRAADRATELTRQLLTFARQHPARIGLVDVNEVVRGIEKLLRKLVRADTRLELALQPALPRIVADTGQLEQVIMNLVVNARDARGGVISIRTLHTSHARDHVAGDATIPAGEYVQMAVSDNGCGMSDDVLRRIFDPFFTTKTEGTGLGLATVRGIVTQMGGYIAVHSAENTGSTFTIYLPAEPRD